MEGIKTYLNDIKEYLTLFGKYFKIIESTIKYLDNRRYLEMQELFNQLSSLNVLDLTKESNLFTVLNTLKDISEQIITLNSIVINDNYINNLVQSSSQSFGTEVHNLRSSILDNHKKQEDDIAEYNKNIITEFYNFLKSSNVDLYNAKAVFSIFKENPGARLVILKLLEEYDIKNPELLDILENYILFGGDIIKRLNVHFLYPNIYRDTLEGAFEDAKLPYNKSLDMIANIKKLETPNVGYLVIHSEINNCNSLISYDVRGLIDVPYIFANNLNIPEKSGLTYKTIQRFDVIKEVPEKKDATLIDIDPLYKGKKQVVIIDNVGGNYRICQYRGDVYVPVEFIYNSYEQQVEKYNELVEKEIISGAMRDNTDILVKEREVSENLRKVAYHTHLNILLRNNMLNEFKYFKSTAEFLRSLDKTDVLMKSIIKTYEIRNSSTEILLRFLYQANKMISSLKEEVRKVVKRRNQQSDLREKDWEEILDEVFRKSTLKTLMGEINLDLRRYILNE
jgi:hypothetical protein